MGEKREWEEEKDGIGKSGGRGEEEQGWEGRRKGGNTKGTQKRGESVEELNQKGSTEMGREREDLQWWMKNRTEETRARRKGRQGSR